MAYNVNGKIYTSHPLMDEIVFNAKLILKGIVVKNDVLANSYEDEAYYDDVQIFMMIKNNTISFDTFPFTREILYAYGYRNPKLFDYLDNKYTIPEEDRDDLLSFSCNYFIEHYEEKNKYYRTLMGLPEYGTNEYNVYIDNSYLPNNYSNKDIDLSKPIYELDTKLISILQYNGKIDSLLNMYKGSNYSYLRFLGDRSIDLYKARKADKYDILYIPSVEGLVKDKFQQIYNLNKEIYLKRTYSDAYAYGSDYYEQLMIIMILAQTFNDIIVDTPEWYIRRDIFDIRSVQYFLESFGVAFYKEIPLKYQIRIVKNLNKLIKYKSSNKNFADILEIFSLKNTAIYKYYLFKNRLTENGNYIESDKLEDKYDLEFIKAKINESYDDYIKDPIYKYKYNEITLEDKYWDGEQDHEYVKHKHLERDFSIEGTKYMSIDYQVSMSEYLFQMQYFVGLIIDSKIDFKDLTINISTIEHGISFKLIDLFLLLFLLSLGYDNSSTKIIRPGKKDAYEYTTFINIDGGYPNTKNYEKDFDGDNASITPEEELDMIDVDARYAENEIHSYITLKSKEKPKFTRYDDFDGGYSYTHEEEYDITYSANGSDYSYLSADGGNSIEYSEIKFQEYFDNWLKFWNNEFYYDHSDTRVYGFNNIDLSEIEEIVTRYHSKFQFSRGFTLEELGIDKYISPTSSHLNSIDDLIKLYYNNKECYDNLKSKMEEAENYDEFTTLNYVFSKLFTKEFDFDFHKVNGKDATILDEILEDRDYVLYNYYKKLMSEDNIETRRDNIRAAMNDIISTLEYYMSGDGLEYIFGFTSTNSFNSLIKYIYLMINFFKSYKVYFLDPYVTYLADDKVENFSGGRDHLFEFKETSSKWDKLYSNDTITIKPFMQLDENAVYKELLDIYAHFEDDPDDDYDYDGMYAKDLTNYKMADGGYADDNSCIPYVMLNGGSSYHGVINLFDIDGSSADLQTSEYVDADGGYPLSLDDYHTDFLGKGFRYILDGGSAGTNQFISKSMHIRVEDKQVSADVKVSNIYGNKLVTLDDGLYLENSWVDWNSFSDFNNVISKTMDYVTDSYNDLMGKIEIVDDNYVDQAIQEAISNKLHGLRKIVNYIDSGDFESSLNDYVDEGNQKLYDEFYSYTPYSWGEF